MRIRFDLKISLITRVILALALLIHAFMASADTIAEANWGIAIGYRDAEIPYPANSELVNDFIPLLFYDGDVFFIRALTVGAKLYKEGPWQFSLLGRYRYLDIPEEYQNRVQGNEFDVGAEIAYFFDNDIEASYELMTDHEGRYYSAVGTRYHWDTGPWDFFPYAYLRFKSAAFNDRYFGLDGYTNPNGSSENLSNKIGSGVDFTLGSEIRYHVISNLYLLGRAQVTVLDKNTYDSPTIQDKTYSEIYLGIAFFNNKTGDKLSPLDTKPFIRLAHGWATPSNVGEILQGDSEGDKQHNQLTSIFYGYPVADSFFGIEAIDVYMMVGYVYHQNADTYTQTLAVGEGINSVKDSDLQGNSCDGTSPCSISYDSQPTSEYVLGVKFYYNLYWPTHWRFGLGEGLSYIEHVSNIEQREMDRQGYRSSKLMNYIDATLDVSLGDAFDYQEMKNLYLGVGLHHRSAIFESNSTFGRIKGGSNYETLYLQYHF